MTIAPVRIEKLLVANRGEIARRIFRTCREMAIATVAVFSEPDREAPFVAEADEAVALGGATPAESYLQIEALLDAAHRTGADAVHPGYGFLAESAAFASAVTDAGLIWVGPPASAIAAMGSKLEAKQLMSRAGVPLLPSAVIAGLDGDELIETAGQIGWPVLVKASAGGGGKGMRIVSSPDQLVAAVDGAGREAAAAFGDDVLFLERYLESARHVEIQVLGDTHGNLVHLFERECSIQRRHQKIIEESPSPAVDDALRQRMGETALVAARAVDYVSAGTVEFMLQNGEFFFLEMNTRLQVEHPVTEMVTGLDLVRLQIEIARGKPLPDAALVPRLQGHAVEARLYAEDPANGFLPASGTLYRFRVAGSGVRVDSGVEDGSEVSVHYDPMLAKVIVHAADRDEAAALLAASLTGGEIHGVTTNRELLVRVLRHPDFLAGDTDTHFLERHDPGELAAPLPDLAGRRLNAVAAALAAQAERRAAATVQANFPSGWRNSPSQLQQVSFSEPDGEITVGYRLTPRGDVIEVDGEPLLEARIHRCRPEVVDLEVAGVRRRFRVRRHGDNHFVDSPCGPSHFVEKARYPTVQLEEDSGSLHAPMPGRVVRLLVEEGDRVEAGHPLLILEAMKMEHTLRAPHEGTVTSIKTREDDQVVADQVLVVVE